MADDQLAPADVARLERLVADARTQADQAMALAREGVTVVDVDTVVGSMYGFALRTNPHELALTVAGLIGHLLRRETEVAELKRDRAWEANRANEAARLSAEARDRADELVRQIVALQEQVAIVEGDRTDMDLWAVNLVAEFGLEQGGEPLGVIARHVRATQARLDEAKAQWGRALDLAERTQAELERQRPVIETARAAVLELGNKIPGGADWDERVAYRLGLLMVAVNVVDAEGEATP